MRGRIPPLLAAVAVLYLPLARAAPVRDNDFPTSARVEYVLECMSQHGGRQEYLYKCSCVIDRIGAGLAYEDYVAMSAALRYQSLQGERGAEFRDPKNVKDMAGRYKTLLAEAEKACLTL
ncbi:hypothetical protein IP91_00210 [Pseudoduganella lurida]|uniref:Uncharacterized protein n=1 Tax=Pseudoduganella lurida TaxID=1036180 RepID=A0A562RKM2_9BURK|nr:hypothetical protein [Pseudoduganella lurida]TWI69144.1 hypothetical protein IP91_00210 [Pseudoduganella lurida]